MWTSKYIVLLLLCTTLVGCNSVVDFSIEDAKNQPWLYSFVEEYELVEGTHDLSNGTIKMIIRADVFTDYYAHCDSVANEGEWNISYKSPHSRVYLKNIPFQKGTEDVIIIKTSYHKPDLIELVVY